jgi:hypothetical protein
LRNVGARDARGEELMRGVERGARVEGLIGGVEREVRCEGVEGFEAFEV